MPELTEWLNSINKSKTDLIKDPDGDPIASEKEYKKLAYIINRCYSYFPDTIFYAQEMNMRTHLDGKPQYEFYLHGLKPDKRFSKWFKAENPEHLEIVKEYYQYNTKKAREALKILTIDDIEYIKARLFRGGVGKKKK